MGIAIARGNSTNGQSHLDGLHYPISAVLIMEDDPDLAARVTFQTDSYSSSEAPPQIDQKDRRVR